MQKKKKKKFTIILDFGQFIKQGICNTKITKNKILLCFTKHANINPRAKFSSQTSKILDLHGNIPNHFKFITFQNVITWLRIDRTYIQFKVPNGDFRQNKQPGLKDLRLKQPMNNHSPEVHALVNSNKISMLNMLHRNTVSKGNLKKKYRSRCT